MSDLVVWGGAVVTPAGRFDADVVVRSGRIVDVVRRSDSSGPRRSPGPGPGLDATGLVVVPGLIDLQCNGAGGIDLAETPERLWEVAALLPRWGVTAWLPTIITSPASVRDRALAALRAGPPAAAGPVAVPLGLHFEGPFLAPDRRGAHPPEHLRLPDPDAVVGWSREDGVAVVTLAPELPGALDLVLTLVERDVVVSLGHSAASIEQATAAIDAGARWVTHLFNAMGPLHHRDPGLPGVALTDERLAVGLIADGVHVHPLAVRLAARALGTRLTLVTDAVAALAAPPDPTRLAAGEAFPRGEAERPPASLAGPGDPAVGLGDVHPRVGGEAGDAGEVAAGGPESAGPAVWLANGTLAGSVCPFDQAVANLWTMGGESLEDALAAATIAPARLLGLDGERGVVAPGAVGDLVLLDVRGPGEIRAAATVIGGEVAYLDPAVKVTGGRRHRR